MADYKTTGAVPKAGDSNYDANRVKQFILDCRREAEEEKRPRMNLNRDNFSMYQLEHSFAHKQEGQSKEVLGKTRNATDQIRSFFQQALADLDDWWRAVPRDGTDGNAMLVRPGEVQKLTNYMLNKADYFSHVGNSVQSGLLGSLMVTKTRGEIMSKPKFKTRAEGKGKSYRKFVVAVDDKAWELRFDIIRQENYYPDNSGYKVYEVEDVFIPLHIVKQLSEGDDAIYDSAAVKDLKPWTNTDVQDERKARETGENLPAVDPIPRVKLTEFYGTIVDSANGEILYENVVATLANDEHMIRPPTPNPLWHQRSPIIAAALMEVANSVWGVALMDAGTKHNRSLIEIFNLMLDSAMKAVWGINQIRVDMLEDPTQVTDSIPWGTNIKTSSALPIGGKVMEPVVTGDIPPEVMNMYNLVNQEAMTSMMTNDMRMGAQSFRQVKATEVVAAENSITSVFQGIAKNVEQKKIMPELELAVFTVAQNWDLIDKEVFKSLFGPQRGEELSQMEPQDVFVAIVNGYKFEVYGISLVLRRQADFRKWQTLLQVIASSPVLTEAFLTKYTFEKLLGEIITSIDIDKSKITADNGAVTTPPQPPPNPANNQPGAAPGASPNTASQTPQASAAPAPSANPLAQAFQMQVSRGNPGGPGTSGAV